ncbi:MAG: hypothetical protein R3Y26_11145 [Rikenellaceae bacterium]
MKKLLSLVLLFTVSVLLTNCDKNDYEGEVVFRLHEKYYGCELLIYPYGYSTSSGAIYSTTIESGTIEVDLNIGDYKFIINGTTSAGTYESGTFQLKSGETITYEYLYTNS